MEFTFRHAQKDRLDAEGTMGGNTGCSLLYVTPGVLVSLGGGVVVRFACQIPVVRGVNGFQKERAVANVGITYVFPN